MCYNITNLRMKTKERIISFFPLNIFLLPGDDIPLRVFEPRYKQLINECRESGLSFGIPFVRDKKIQEFGSEVSVKQVVAENSLGEMVILIEGVSVFKILSIEDPIGDKLYSGGRIKGFSSNQAVNDKELMNILIYYMDHLDHEFIKDISKNEILIYDIARALNLSSADKYTFISLKDPALKEKFLYSRMKYLIKLREQEKLLKNDYFLN